MQWERIDTAEVTLGSGFFKSSVDVVLSRTPVPGGWLVLAVTPNAQGATSAITFYPDPSHSWDAGSSQTG